MKNMINMLMFVFTLGLSTNAFAAASSTQSTFAVFGGTDFSTTSTATHLSSPVLNYPLSSYAANSANPLKTLVSTLNNGAANNFTGFYEFGASTQYTPPSNKYFHVIQVCVNANATGGAIEFNLGSATATFTEGTTSAPTGATYMGGVAAQYPFHMAAIGTWNLNCFSMSFDFTNGKYPFAKQQSTALGSVMMLGYEI